MDDKWRHRFLTWGMVIAVFGTRFAFPILIVWGTSSLSLLQSTILPFENAKLYAETVSAAHVKIAGFGGSFLLMVFLAYMFDDEKETNWVPGLERAMQWLGARGGLWPVIAWNGLITLLVQYCIIKNHDDQTAFGIASGAGTLVWLLVHWIGEKLQGDGNKTAAAAGLGSFLYLEVLDSSFSFDGVVSAFAITDSIVLIALGLGIGAMFVRSMTLHMVDKGTLNSLKYLENGAFWSIGVLTALMFAGTVHEIPEVVTGLSAALILGAATIHSLLVKKSEAVAAS